MSNYSDIEIISMLLLHINFIISQQHPQTKVSISLIPFQQQVVIKFNGKFSYEAANQYSEIIKQKITVITNQLLLKKENKACATLKLQFIVVDLLFMTLISNTCVGHQKNLLLNNNYYGFAAQLLRENANNANNDNDEDFKSSDNGLESDFTVDIK